MSDKIKRVIVYSVSAAAYAALAIGTAVGADFSWWQPAVAVIGFVLGEVLGVEWVPPKRRK